MEIYFEEPGKSLDSRRNFSYWGVRSVASENKAELEKIAEELWLEPHESHPISPDMVIIRDSQTLEVDGHTIHYASAVGYIGD